MLHYFLKYGGINMFDWDKVREFAQRAGTAALEKGKEKLANTHFLIILY